jgi:hypothetical protein
MKTCKRKGFKMAVRVIVYFIFCFAFGVLHAKAVPSLTLPPVVHFDTETSTNMPFAIGSSGAGRFSLSLSCIATPSNNVEAAFGYDSNLDGVLDLGEMSFTIGWDCGAWFVRQGCDGIRIEEPYASTNEVKTLLLNLRFGTSGQPRRLEAAADGQPVFSAIAAAPPEWLNVRRCNRLRLTGRGLDGHGESFEVGTTIDAIAIRYR